MTPLLLVTALVCWLAVGGRTSVGVMADPNLRQVLETAEACPRCDMIFTMLETDSSGRRVQQIDVVERGKGVSFIVRILPLAPLLVYAHYVGCSFASCRNTLRGVQETSIRYCSCTYCI